MTNEHIQLNQFDEWLEETSEVAAMVMRQWLEPVEGRDGVIFPPTYAKPERMREEEWMGYNIDHFQDGTSVCQIDSVGSQANRMEPLFERTPYRDLVPQVVIKAGEEKVNLLEAGHRAADAIVRFSDLSGDLSRAFEAAQNGNAEPLAKIAPTSLIFGAWDSRATQVKLPRIVRSVIRAYGVRPLHRSAQYIPALDYVGMGLLDASEGKTQQESMSELGLSHAPAPWSHGGVQLEDQGSIRRDATLNLVVLRSLGAGSQEDEASLKLRRYILGLALVSLTAPQDLSLREGCQLVPETGRPTEWKLVHHDGRREDLDLSHARALEYAEAAARAFGVGADREAIFDPKAAKAAIGQSKEERKKARRKKSGNAAPGDET